MTGNAQIPETDVFAPPGEPYMRVQRLIRIPLACIALFLGGCAWVSYDRYYSAKTADSGWKCFHYNSHVNCQYSTADFAVGVSLQDVSNHTTWFGIWPIPFVPVWFLTSVQERDPTAKIGLAISWNAKNGKVVIHDARSIKLLSDSAAAFTPITARYSEMSSDHKVIETEVTGPISTARYGFDYVSYDLMSWPSKFTLDIGSAHVDGREIVLPPLTAELMDGYHYEISSL